MVDLTDVVANQEVIRSKRKNQVTIPEPYQTVESLYRTVSVMKELIEVLAGQRGQAYDAAVTWQDMLDLQQISKADIPTTIGQHPIKP
jgi:hypothetical protein